MNNWSFPGNHGRNSKSIATGRLVDTQCHLDHHWKLRQQMASHQMWKTTQFAPLFDERDIEVARIADGFN